MASCSYILNRKGSYYFRIAIPSHLRLAFGVLELNRSLQTKYLPAAKERSTILLTSVRELFKLVSAMPNLSPDEIKQLSRTYFHEVVFPRVETWLESIRLASDYRKVLPSVSYEEREGPSIPKLIEQLIHPKGYQDGFLIAMGKELMKTQKVEISRGSINFKELLRQGMEPVRQEVESLVTLATHSQPAEIQTEWLKPVAKAQAEASTLTISQLFSKYESEAGETGKDMLQQHQTALTYWQDIFGDTLISEINVPIAAKLVVYLQKIPKGWKGREAYRNLKASEFLTMSLPDNDKASIKTINDRLSIYRKVFAWAIIVELYPPKNPFKDLRVKQGGKPKDQRHPYTLDQLKTIFSSPLYVGCKSESRRSQAGEKIIWDGFYWVPLIALLSGARMNEICQLSQNDIRQEEGIWVFDIREEQEDQVLKTDAATAPFTKIYPLRMINHLL